MPSQRRRLQPPPHLAADAPRPPEVREFLRAELHCYLCGFACGTVESAFVDRIPPVAPFRAIGADAAVTMAWRSVRCPRCNGSTFVEEVERVRERIDHVNWQLDQPRRGRPPKWLVEMRQLEAA